MDQQFIKQKIEQVGPILKEDGQTSLFTAQKPLEQQLQSPVNTNQLNKEEFEKALFDRMQTRETFKSTEINEVSSKLSDLSKKITKVDKELSITSKSISEKCRLLLKDTASAIKITSNSIHSNNLTNSRFLDARQALLDATKVVESVSEKIEEGKTQHATIEELCENIIHGVGFTYSKMYKNVVDAAKNYMKLDKTQRLDSAEYSLLVDAVNTYVESRSKGGSKKKYFWSSGAKRMEWMKNLQGALKEQNTLEESTEEERLQKFSKKVLEEDNQIENIKTLELKINARVEALAKVPHPEWIVQEKYMHQKNDCMYEIIKIYITDRMLEPDYVRAHKEEFYHYIQVINDVRSIFHGFDDVTRKKWTKETGSSFPGKAMRSLKHYDKLEEYVNSCLAFKDDEAKEIRKMVDTWKANEKYIKAANRLLEFNLDRDICYERILRIFPLEKYAHSLVKEVPRFRSVVTPWKVNEKGEPASDKDMAIYKDNLRLFSTMFEGTIAEYIYVVDKKYKDFLANTSVADENIENVDYVAEHAVELEAESKFRINYENLMKARLEVNFAEAESFAKKYYNSTIAEDIKKIECVTAPKGYLIDHMLNYDIGNQEVSFLEFDKEKIDSNKTDYQMIYNEALKQLQNKL